MKGSSWKRTAAAAAALMIVCAAIPAQPYGGFPGQTVLTAYAENLVEYLDAEHNTAAAECEPITSSSTEVGVTGTETWYVAKGEVTCSDFLTINGTVNLILAEGCTLTAKKGIRVKGDATFRIFAQTEESGTLTATGAVSGNIYQAGIGANTSYTYGTIEIYGGTVNATGSKNAAGIGGAQRTSGTAILIAGGVVNVQGGTNAAGIGGGNVGDGGNITITGGTVTTTGGRNGAGIGGGQTGNGGNITITGGTVTAIAGEADVNQHNGGAGIGSGKNNVPSQYQTSGGTITITGGKITAVGSDNSAGIGGGYGGGSGSINIDGAEEITAVGQNGCDAIGSGASPTVEEGSVSIKNTCVNGCYYDENGFCYSGITAPEYVQISCDVTQINGEQTVYAAGKTVKLAPADGYELENVAAEYNGTALELTQTDDGWTFIMPEGEVTVTADSVRVFEDGIGEAAGQTLSLEGDIRINIYMELDPSVLEDEEAYMCFTMPDNSKQKVMVSSVKDNPRTADGKTCYVFPCSVAAKNMTDEIKAQMICSDRSGKEYTCSVRAYAEYIIDNKDKVPEYVAAEELVYSMLNYGAYAQKYFNYEPDDPANRNTVTDQQTEAINAVTAESTGCIYDASTENLPEGVVFEGANLILESETVLKLYFSNKTGKDVTLSAKDASFTTGRSDDDYDVIIITGIPAQHLAKPVEIQLTLEDGEEVYSVAYSSMNYCSNILSMETAGDITAELKDLMRAFCLYQKAADEYF